VSVCVFVVVVVRNPLFFHFLGWKIQVQKAPLSDLSRPPHFKRRKEFINSTRRERESQILSHEVLLALFIRGPAARAATR